MRRHKNNLEPVFYSDFRCSASDCPITCCQEWRIWVDEATQKRWTNLTFQDRPLCSHLEQDPDGGKMIRLGKDRHCPFLAEDRLCSLVKEHGDKILSETCDTFPRQIHTYPNRVERALMPGCPVTIDMLKTTSPFPEGLMEAGSDDTSTEDLWITPGADLTVRALRSVRSGLLQLMMQEDLTPQESLMIGFYLLLELREQLRNYALRKDPAKAIQGVRQTLQNLHDPKACRNYSTVIREMTFHEEDMLLENLELFGDLASNYRREGRYNAFLEPLCSQAENLSDNVEELSALWTKFLPEWDEYLPLFRHYLEQECFTSLLNKDFSLTTLICHYQWMVMAAMAIRQSVFLRWTLNPNLTYEDVRECFCILSRMTGYDDDDIEDYLFSMFDELVWEWGYLAMLTGR